MIPKFTNYEDNIGAMLRCPSCGGTAMQHSEIEVFNRTEDSRYGIHVRMDAFRRVITDDDVTKDPFAHRSSIKITFACDYCHESSALVFREFKNHTNVNIDRAYPPIPTPLCKPNTKSK